MNCGFVSWVDEEWEPTLQKSLTRLWGMHSDILNSLDCEREQNSLVLHNLADEKRKIKEKYTSLLADVKKYMEETNKRIVQENYNTIRKKSKTDLGHMEKENIDLKNEVEELKNDVCWLKNVQRTQADIMKARQQKWAAEKVAMQEEKALFEKLLFEQKNGPDPTKDKVASIRKICDE